MRRGNLFHHARCDSVQWKIAGVLALAGIVGAWFGSLWDLFRLKALERRRLAALIRENVTEQCRKLGR